ARGAAVVGGGRGGGAVARGGDGLEQRMEVRDDVVPPADHQAEAAVEPEHAAARADVDVVDPLLRQRLRTVDVVAVEAVATVDDDVARIHQVGDLHDDTLGDAGGGHHPPPPRPFPRLPE